MAQFTAYENKNIATKKTYPYLLDIQSGILDQLKTTVVVPLCPAFSIEGPAITKLCPIVKIHNENYIALTQQLAGIDRKSLGKVVGDLSNYRSEIISAFDFIISGI